MRIPRVYSTNIHPGLHALDPDEARHLAVVLRRGPGAEVEVFDGRGTIGRAVLAFGESSRGAKRGKQPAATDRAWSVDVRHVWQVPLPTPRLTILVATPKGERLDWMVEKCTELGLHRLQLTQFERSVARAEGSKLNRILRTAVESAKQCGSPWIPLIGASSLPTSPAEFAVVNGSHPTGAGVASGSPRGSTLLIAHPGSCARPVLHALAPCAMAQRDATIVIGPEGGLTDRELAQLREQGAVEVRLADTILRVETAAVTVAAVWAASNSKPLDGAAAETPDEIPMREAGR